MIWTERFEIRRGCKVYGQDRGLKESYKWSMPVQWQWPLIRRDRLETMIHLHYHFAAPSDHAKLDQMIRELPVFEYRGYGRFNFYDLQIVVRFLPEFPPKVPSMWRCMGCGGRIFRPAQRLYWQYREGFGKCHPRDECVEKAAVIMERQRKELSDFKLAKRSLREVRKWLRDRGVA